MHAASATMGECIVPRGVAVYSPAVEVGAALSGHILPNRPLNARHIGQKSTGAIRARNGMTTYIGDEAANLLKVADDGLGLLLGVAAVVVVDGGVAILLAEELFDGFGVGEIDRTDLKRG